MLPFLDSPFLYSSPSCSRETVTFFAFLSSDFPVVCPNLTGITHRTVQDTAAAAAAWGAGAQRTAAIHFHLMSHKFVACSKERGKERAEQSRAYVMQLEAMAYDVLSALGILWHWHASPSAAHAQNLFAFLFILPLCNDLKSPLASELHPFLFWEGRRCSRSWSFSVLLLANAGKV